MSKNCVSWNVNQMLSDTENIHGLNAYQPYFPSTRLVSLQGPHWNDPCESQAYGIDGFQLWENITKLADILKYN